MTDPDRSAHPSVARVLAALAAADLTPTVRHLPDAVRTAAAAAEALGVSPAEIANSLVFAADAGDGTDPTPVLVIASGGHRVDLAALSTTLGLPSLRRARPEEVRDWTGFAIGGVAPVGHAQPLLTVIDTALAGFARVWAAAGHSHSVYQTSYAELVTVTGGRPLDVA